MKQWLVLTIFFFCLGTVVADVLVGLNLPWLLGSLVCSAALVAVATVAQARLARTSR